MPDTQPVRLPVSRVVPLLEVERSLVVVFSHLRWDFVFQRPQHLITRAARSSEVVFWEEVIWTDGGKPRVDLSLHSDGITVAVPHVPQGMNAQWTDAAQRQLLDQVLADRQAQCRPFTAWFYTPMALTFAAHLRPDTTVYDCMDELSAFRGAPTRMVEMEQRLLARADLVFAGGRSLYEAKHGRHAHVHCFASSIDASHFEQARLSQPDPIDQAKIPCPRLGFFGVIDERLDASLLSALAEARPDWQFVMIGPVVKIDPAVLPRRRNIHWLGAKSYAELPCYLSGWDLGFMPFALDESTRFISPTKTPEFLAAGLPVVSTAVTDVVRDWGETGLVEIAHDAEDMASRAAVLMSRPRTEWLQHVDARLGENSWDSTWAAMERLLEDSRMLRKAQHIPSEPAIARSSGSV